MISVFDLDRKLSLIGDRQEASGNKINVRSTLHVFIIHLSNFTVWFVGPSDVSGCHKLLITLCCS